MNVTYERMKALIKQKRYTLDLGMRMLDAFMQTERISPDEYVELATLLQENHR